MARDAVLLPTLNEEREGFAYERAFRLLCFVLNGWCNYSGERPESVDEPRNELRAIQFDKLAMLIMRTWDQLFRESNFDRASGDSNLVTFPCPLQEMPGKHGPGRAVMTGVGQKPKFITELAYEASKNNIFPYFDVRPPAGTHDASDFRTTVCCGIPNIDRNEFINDFSSREQRIILDLENSFKRLGAGEIRALGTHENLEKTIEDIRRELYWVTGQIPAVEREMLSNRVLLHGPVQKIVEFADEACRKSDRNRSDYERGRQRVLRELNDPDVRAAFATCQAEPREIWGHERMEIWVSRARRLYAVASYLELLSRAQDRRLKGEVIGTADAAKIEKELERLKHDAKYDLPISLGLIFDSDGRLADEVRQPILQILKSAANTDAK